jgi:hypothetical protein
LAELNLKFNEKVMDLLSISVTLVPRNGFADFQSKEICRIVEKYYLLDFNQQEMVGLERQLNRFINDGSTNEDMKSISTLVDLCRGFVKTVRHRIHNLVDRLICLLVTLPVSTATAEHIFLVSTATATRWKINTLPTACLFRSKVKL